LIITSPVKDSRLSGFARNQIQRFLCELEGKNVRIEIKEAKDKRSLAQNRYKWGVVVETVRKALLQQGNDYSADAINDMIKMEILHLTEVVTLPNGKNVIVPGALKDKETSVFQEGMERIRAYFAPYGIDIPEPNEEI